MKKSLIILVFLIANFAFSQTNNVLSENYNEHIKGTWQIVDEPNNQWIFTNTECFWKNEGEISNTFSYTLSTEKSENGKLTFHYLKLTNAYDTNEIYEYEINSINTTSLVLDYIGGLGTKLQYFTKTQ